MVRRKKSTKTEVKKINPTNTSTNNTSTNSDMKKTTIKISAILVVLLLIANGVFFAMGKISAILFWVIIAAGFGISYMIRKQSK